MSEDPFPAAEHAGQSPALRRVISLPWLVLYGLGSTVGAGIYALTGVVAGKVGLLAPVAFALAALLAVCTGLSFAEFSARFPRAGGALIYVREGLRSDFLSLLVGLLSVASAIVSAATVSLAFVGYLAEVQSVPPTLTLLLVISGVVGLAAWGVRESVAAASVVTIVEVLGLIAIIAFGATQLTLEPDTVARAIPSDGFQIEGFALMSATMLGFFAFLGFEDMLNVAEEVRDAPAVLPRAILWTLAFSTLLYVAVSTVAVLVVPPAELAASEAPLSLVFDRSGGSGEALALIALAAMLNGALVQIIMASRILFSLARDGLLPAALGQVNAARRTPIRATLLVGSLVAFGAFTLPIESLARATAACALMVFTLVNLSLIALRIHERNTESGSDWTVPLWAPVLGALFSGGLLLVELFGQQPA